MRATFRLLLTLQLLAALTISGNGLLGDELPGPELRLDGTLAMTLGVPLFVPIDFTANGFMITVIAFSLDLDLDRLDFDPSDDDGDGVPDAVLFPLGTPGLTFVTFDAGDSDGELDVLLANLSGLPLPEGLLIELEVVPLTDGTVASSIAFSQHPPASFGDSEGQDVPGTAVVTGAAEIFADGFESGDLGAWS